MRLDKFLCEMKMGSRSQVKAFARQGLVTVNGKVVRSADVKVDELADEICFRGDRIQYRKFVYYMINKPQGVVSATQDNTAQTVVSLLGNCQRDDIFPVGRLDKDTTGLLLLTNDGELAHRMLSPKNHVDKTYRVEVSCPLTGEEISRLEQGADIGDDEPALPARVTILDERVLLLTIQEGRFHQVKRMLRSVGHSVVGLERVAFGPLRLDVSLKPGEYRELTAEEIAQCRA